MGGAEAGRGGAVTEPINSFIFITEKGRLTFQTMVFLPASASW